MTEVSMHYLTNEPKKIIESFVRRERRAASEAAASEKMYSELIESANPELRRVALSRDNRYFPSDMEDVVVRICGDVLSVYPIMTTERQIKNETWIKFDTRPKAVAQRNASLVVFRTDSGRYMEIWARGVALADTKKTGAAEFCRLLAECFGRGCGGAWERLDFANLERMLGFPLYLPADWREIWDCRRRSEHLWICEA